jgi:TRAP-type mannitol/chloroaromatic compound transport system permease large subunit
MQGMSRFRPRQRAGCGLESSRGGIMSDRTRRRIVTVVLAPVAALIGWAGLRLAGVGLTARGGTLGPADVVAAALIDGLGAWYVVRALERNTRRPRFWWPLVGSTALSVSFIGPSYLADGVDALALGGLHLVTAMVLIWGLGTTLPAPVGGPCEPVPGSRA